jgi:hypothetical protein
MRQGAQGTWETCRTPAKTNTKPAVSFIRSIGIRQPAPLGRHIPYSITVRAFSAVSVIDRPHEVHRAFRSDPHWRCGDGIRQRRLGPAGQPIRESKYVAYGPLRQMRLFSRFYGNFM